jgi:chromosome segregation ATPase
MPDDLELPADQETAKAPPPEKAEDVDHAIHDLKAQGRIIAPGENARPIRVLDKGMLKQMVLELLQKYGNMGEAKLIERIHELEGAAARERERLEAEAEERFQRMEAELRERIKELERQMVEVREKAREEFRARIEELEKMLLVERGRAGDLEAKLAEALAEIDRLSAELAAVQKSITSTEGKTKAELERLVAELQAKILELEMGLDYFTLEEEIDPARMASAVEEAGGRSGDRSDVKDRLAWLSERARVAHETFGLLQQKMHDGKGTVGVVVDMVKQLKSEVSAEDQARRISEVLR